MVHRGNNRDNPSIVMEHHIRVPADRIKINRESCIIPSSKLGHLRTETVSLSLGDYSRSFLFLTMIRTWTRISGHLDLNNCRRDVYISPVSRKIDRMVFKRCLRGRRFVLPSLLACTCIDTYAWSSNNWPSTEYDRELVSLLKRKM